MRFTIIISVLNVMIGYYESKNLQILHIKNVTIDSCGLKSFSTKQEINKSCFRWHKTIVEKQKELKNIENGTDVEIGEFPYTVLILAKTGNTIGKCTGAVINEYWIITAAHCINKFSLNDLRFYTGVSDYTQSSVTFSGADRVFIHEMFNETDSELRYYDIAVIKVTRKIHITNSSRANSVCLPAKAFKINTAELATLTGWGNVKDYQKNERRLQKTVIKLSRIYEFNHIAIVTDEIIKGKPCAGDSGGPLVQYVNGRAVLIGLLRSTWDDEGKPCGPISKIYFLSVPFHMNWIIEKIKNN